MRVVAQVTGDLELTANIISGRHAFRDGANLGLTAQGDPDIL